MKTGENTLVTKLTNVMSQVGYIPKNGYNSFHKYKYATESDVADKVRDLLAEQNVMMMPSVVEHTVREYKDKGYINTVTMEFVFMDGDSGETISVRSVGEAQDATDKGCYKAITGATKYALMKVFMIPTGDDPELDNRSTENGTKTTKPKAEKAKPSTNGGAKDAQIQAIAKISKTKGIDASQLRDILFDVAAVDHTKDLTFEDASAVIAKLNEVG